MQLPVHLPASRSPAVLALCRLARFLGTRLHVCRGHLAPSLLTDRKHYRIDVLHPESVNRQRAVYSVDVHWSATAVWRYLFLPVSWLSYWGRTHGSLGTSSLMLGMWGMRLARHLYVHGSGGRPRRLAGDGRTSDVPLSRDCRGSASVLRMLKPTMTLFFIIAERLSVAAVPCEIDGAIPVDGGRRFVVLWLLCVRGIIEPPPFELALISNGVADDSRLDLDSLTYYHTFAGILMRSP